VKNIFCWIVILLKKLLDKLWFGGFSKHHFLNILYEPIVPQKVVKHHLIAQGSTQPRGPLLIQLSNILKSNCSKWVNRNNKKVFEWLKKTSTNCIRTVEKSKLVYFSVSVISWCFQNLPNHDLPNSQNAEFPIYQIL